VIAYFTAPALVALVIDAPVSAIAEQMWAHADRVATSVLTELEARTMIAGASRHKIITPRQVPACVGRLQSLLQQLDRVAVDEELVHSASELVPTRELTWVEALHVSSAQRLAEEDVVFVARDQHLLDVASNLGLVTASLGPA
jgi:predicted nucleic acid-binding protein